MSTIDDLPTRPAIGQDFGQAFNYSVWTPETNVELCRVPWNSDYRDIVKFESEAALQFYLDSSATPPVSVGRLSYARVGDPIRLNLPFNQVYQYNYIRVTNPAQPITSTYPDGQGISRTMQDVARSYYYFITDVKYLTPQTTEIQIQLDVWQTFGFDVKFGNCYIEQGHIGIANENAFNNNGRDYLTVPEGLDIGDEYTIYNSYKYDVNHAGSDNTPSCWVIMGIGADVTADPGDASNPTLVMAEGSDAENLPQGCDLIVFKSTQDFKLFTGIFSDAPWVTDTVQFIMAIPPILGADANLEQINIHGNYNGIAYRFSGSYTASYDKLVFGNWRELAKANIPARYRGLSKFLTFPYCLMEMTTYTGQPLILKPELMPGNDLTMTTIQHMSPPSPRWAFVPKHYNAPTDTGNADDGEYLDVATFLTDFPQFTVLNSGYLNYLASNRNQIAYQYSSSNWDYMKAMQGNQVQLNQANAGITNQMQQYAADIQARNATTNLQNVMGGANAARNIMANGIGDIASGNIGGAIGGAMNTAVGAGMAMMQNTQQTAIDNAQSTAKVQASTSLGAYLADTNKSYSDYAAKGDYQNAITGIQARVRDAKMIQPTVSGQMGGESFMLWAYGGFNVFFKIKQINLGMMRMIGEYWLRYGYAVNQFGTIPDSLQVMDKFTYWKLKETYITSWKCPETFKQTIRGIFEKGVTVWSNPNDIGTIDLATNTPVAGITL